MSDAFVPGEGLHVMRKRCDVCLYSKKKVVSDERKADLISSCRSSGQYFICHKTQTNSPAVCRGFFDEERNQTCQLAYRLCIVKEVDAPHE